MTGLAWNWLCLPYLACGLALIAVGLVAAVIRGDRVLRLGAIGAATTALPWAFGSAAVTWTSDPELAVRLLRLGTGPLALIGPCLLLVMLGATGQLERHRWMVRISGVIGLVLVAVCWMTDWMVAGVRPLSSGILYLSPGPLTGLHLSHIGIWLAVGLMIARRSTAGRERRRVVFVLVLTLALCVVGAADLLLVYDIVGTYPIVWLPATIGAGIAVYYELTSDLLRPQGLDRGAMIEIGALSIATAVISVLVVLLDDVASVAVAGISSLVWTAALAIAWANAHKRPVRMRERALEQFVASLGELDGDARISEQLAALWRQIGIETRVVGRVDGDQLIEVGPFAVPVGGASRKLDREVVAWFVAHGDALSAGDRGTMLLGAIRSKLDAFVDERKATLIVPLIDRGTLIGLVEADHRAALREDERGLVLESARATARALTYVALAHAAARERETAREVEVAEAMRLQASASRDDELGRWAVTAEYQTAARTTGAGWSATLLSDGRLAVLVTEAQAHGVAAALATAALTGAFAAASRTRARIDLDTLLTSLRASAEGVVRGGEPVAAFVAILDAEAGSIDWACAGHPGAVLVGPIEMPDLLASARGSRDRLTEEDPVGRPSGAIPPAILLGGGGAGLGSLATTRGATELPIGALLVVASTGLRGADDSAWSAILRGAAPAGPRLAAMLVDGALQAGAPGEDLLAVVVRQRRLG